MRFSLVLLLLAVPALAQPSPPSRPKIGLVFEGGSALGLAHIGVLEYLEENRIPVDYVAGASMGALIGGIYSTGTPPAEIRTLLKSIDWREMMEGDVQYQDLAFRRKEDRIAFPNRLEIGLRHGLNLPPGFNSGQFVGTLLSHFALPYGHMDSFDNLPIPYRCVAAGLRSGKTRVFDKGSLADAMRATMSLPGIFDPVIEGNEVYVDGGLIENLPVDVVRAMGADIVIAIHLVPRVPEMGELRSITGILVRSVSVVVADNEFRSMQKADIVVPIDLTQFSVNSYQAANDIANKGREGARLKQNILQRFALDEEGWRRHLEQRNARRKPMPTEIRDVRVHSEYEPLRKTLEQNLRQALNRGFSEAAVRRELSRALGQGRFSSIGYDVDGQVLNIRPREKLHGPPFLYAGFDIDGTDLQDVRFAINLRAVMLDLGGYRSELRADLTAGGRYHAGVEYYRPFTASSPFFFAPRAYIDSRVLDLYSGRDRLLQFSLSERGVAADVGWNINRFSELRFGYSAHTFKLRNRIGETDLQEFDSRNDFLQLRYAYEGEDDPIVPTRGGRLTAEGRWYPGVASSFAPYKTLEIRSSGALPLTGSGSIVGSLSGGFAQDIRNAPFPPYLLGSPSRLAAYGVNELLATRYWLASGGYLHRVPTGLLGNKLYVLGVAQGGSVTTINNGDGMAYSLSGNVIYRSLLGPIFAGGAYGSGGRSRWFFGVGRLY